MSGIGLADLPGAGGALALDTAIPGAAGRFRRVLRLALPTGGDAETLEFADGATLAFRFDERSFDAVGPGAPVAAQLSREGGKLVVRLPRAMTIVRVELASRQSGDALLAFRFDGEVVSDDPVASAPVQAGGARLDTQAAALILRRRRGGADQDLSVSDVTRVWLGAPASNPRLSIAVVGDPAGWQPLPPETDPEGNPLFSASAERGPAVAAAIASALARWRAASGAAVLPHPAEVDVAFEADAPCLVSVTALALEHRLGRASFADGSQKRVLRLRGHGLSPVSTLVDVPAAAGFDVATLRISVAAQGARDAGTAAAGAPPPPAASGEGRIVTAGGALASLTLLHTPRAIAAIGLAAAGIDGPCSARFLAWADAGGVPGAMLFAAEALTLPPGAPRLAMARLPAPAVADAGALWLGVEALSGRCHVALAAGAGAGILARAGTEWQRLTALAARAAVVVLTTPPETAGAPPTEAPVTITLGGISVPLGGAEGAWTGDLLPALAAGDASVRRALPLALSGPGPAVVTLRSPVLRYRVGT